MVYSYGETKPTSLENLSGRVRRRSWLFLFAILLLLQGIAFTTLCWIIAHKLDAQLSVIQRLSVFMQLLLSLLLAVFSLIGIYSAVARPTLASFYGSLIIGHFVPSIAAGALALYVLYHPSTPSPDGPGQMVLYTDYDRCLRAVATNPHDATFLRQLCARTPALKGICIAFLVLGWVLQLISAYTSRGHSSETKPKKGSFDDLGPSRSSFYV